jgi:hypothetical protein
MSNMKVNHMASGDLDGDGDPDLVAAITRHNPYYKGRKILIFINEDGKLVEKTNELIQDVRDQDINGIPQNHGEGSIRLIDHDRDGDLDIIDSSGGSYEVNARIGLTIFENDGNAHFTEIPDSEFLVLRYSGPETSTGYPIDIDGIGRIDYVSFLRSAYSPSSQSVSVYSVLGREKPIDIEIQIKAEKAQSKTDEDAELAAAIAKRKAEVAAAKAKRLAEEAAKAAETDTVDTEQSAEDEIAAFEAELAAELAEEAAKAAETDTVDTEQSVEDEIAAFEAELAAELGE